MLKNYFILAIRNLFRQKLYSIINIGGLAVGIACSVLLGVYVHSELSYDKFQKHAANLVIAHLEFGMGDGKIEKVALTPTALLPTVIDKMPEVKRGVRLFYPSLFKPALVSVADRAFQEQGFCYADSVFFEMFSFPLLEGAANKVLSEPNQIVLSEASKTKYFGDDDAIGKELVVNGKSLIVSGIMKNIPANSSIQMDFVASISGYLTRDPVWYSANYITYLELVNGANLKVLESKIQTELQALGISNPQNNEYFGIGFTPLLDVHLYSDVHQGGNINNLYAFGSIALLILLIAIINYSNLTTARSFYRAKEVGLRKSLGANRRNVLGQIMGESLVTALISMTLAILLVYFMLPIFAAVSGTSLSMSYLLKPVVVIGLILLYFLIAMLAGAYPAIKMAAFKPIDILKGQYKGSSQGSALRKALIVLQFFISMSLVTATIIIYNQLEFINQKELGYSKDNILVVPVSKTVISKLAEFKNASLQSGLVRSVSMVGETPPNIQGGYSIDLPDNTSIGVVAAAIDESFIETAKMELVAGRPLSLTDIERTRTVEAYSFIINESAAKILGWQPAEAIGQNLKLNGREGVIQGVVKDFHFRALYEKVSPLVLFSEQTWAYNYLMISISGRTKEAINAVEANWKQFDPVTPFTYNFLDQEFDALHVNAARSGKLLTTFSLLALLIASLGLFGIVSFSMVQRAKEIGVRKVLGATVANVLVLTNKEFLSLILIAFILTAVPSYLLMNSWLDSFAYHINISFWPMIISLVITMIIAIATISFESLKAALVNPVKTLRNE